MRGVRLPLGKRNVRADNDFLRGWEAPRKGDAVANGHQGRGRMTLLGRLFGFYPWGGGLLTVESANRIAWNARAFALTCTLLGAALSSMFFVAGVAWAIGAAMMLAGTLVFMFFDQPFYTEDPDRRNWKRRAVRVGGIVVLMYVTSLGGRLFLLQDPVQQQVTKMQRDRVAEIRQHAKGIAVQPLATQIEEARAKEAQRVAELRAEAKVAGNEVNSQAADLARLCAGCEENANASYCTDELKARCGVSGVAGMGVRARANRDEARELTASAEALRGTLQKQARERADAAIRDLHARTDATVAGLERTRVALYAQIDKDDPAMLAETYSGPAMITGGLVDQVKALTIVEAEHLQMSLIVLLLIVFIELFNFVCGSMNQPEYYQVIRQAAAGTDAAVFWVLRNIDWLIRRSEKQLEPSKAEQRRYRREYRAGEHRYRKLLASFERMTSGEAEATSTKRPKLEDFVPKKPELKRDLPEPEVAILLAIHGHARMLLAQLVHEIMGEVRTALTHGAPPPQRGIFSRWRRGHSDIHETTIGGELRNRWLEDIVGTHEMLGAYEIALGRLNIPVEGWDARKFGVEEPREMPDEICNFEEHLQAAQDEDADDGPTDSDATFRQRPDMRGGRTRPNHPGSQAMHRHA